MQSLVSASPNVWSFCSVFIVVLCDVISPEKVLSVSGCTVLI